MMLRDVQTPTLAAVMRALEALMPVAQSRRLSRRRVLAWCRGQRYELLRWRDAKLFEGPSSWKADERHYRIQIVDADGHRRACFLTFARRPLVARCTEVLWDDASGRRVSGTPGRSEDDDTSGLVPVPSLRH